MEKSGRSLFEYKNMPSIISSFAVVGTKEAKGPLKESFDMVLDDDKFGENSWEKAESKMQKEAVYGALRKGGLSTKDIDVICAGDLLNQCIGSAYGLREMAIPFLGLYGACSTMAESLLVSSMAVAGGFAEKCIAVTSSHFCSAERQFRFPLEYGGQRTPSAQWTVTGSGAAVIGSGDYPKAPKIKRVLVGKIVDLGIKDANNMGAAMAPAAADSFKIFFNDTNTKPEDYDLIVTGDLGKIGSDILKDMAFKQGFALGNNYTDCGIEIFDIEKQDVHAGGSGCGCSATVLCGHILPQMINGKYKNILFAATGALMSTVSSQQGESIPGICHIINIVM